MIVLYKILTAFVFILVLPILPLLYLFSKKRRASLAPRLGFSTGLLPGIKTKKRIWIHALSVGEVKSAVPLVKALKETKKNVEIIFTASTQTGFEMATTLFLNESLVDQVAYFPFDLGFSIRRIHQRINADAVVIVETDVWPNFLYEMNKINIPVVLINARLSKRSLNGYLKFKPFVHLFFSFLTRIMAQTALDKERYQKLGIDHKKIVVTGNIKFDQLFEKMDSIAIQKLKQQLGIRKKDEVVLAGSTHEGEEKILLSWFKKVSQRTDTVKLVIAPRNPQRSMMLNKTFLSEKILSALMSEPDLTETHPKVIFVDKMGELSRLYAICDLAFVGGSLVDEGGHNPLEPAVYAKPVLIGPDMSDFTEISKLLINGGGTIMVDSDKRLEEQLNILLNNRERREQMGAENFKIFSAHSGAVKKIVSHMEQLSIV
ncbi:MAG: 3-deoxy-D-manno-octulosonic acid transferase [Pseudomonadota bacterium]